MVGYFYGDKWILISVKFDFIKGIADSGDSSDSSDSECDFGGDFAFSAEVSVTVATAKGNGLPLLWLLQKISYTRHITYFWRRRHRKGLPPLILRSELAAEVSIQSSYTFSNKAKRINKDYYTNKRANCKVILVRIFKPSA